ncbi:monoacylglycerol lipase ABHD12-like isoform X2 [Dendronephthya gigantea]|nr:monoacylglycerol lipase ABHD12-like isoform X2 [Dendronephthya gigantea]
MHGNAYSRAAKHRVATYKVLSALDCHVVAHDYRGFGDSEGIPSEQGIIQDSLTVFQWILANTDNGPVYLWGHSLGSGVAVALSKILTEKNIPVMGIILEAPFNNMREGALYHPLSAPYKFLPFFQDALQEINGLFKNDEIITSIKYDILMLHDHGDEIVKMDLGKKLYEAAVKHKREYQTIIFKELRGYSHTTIYSAPNLPEILRNFMKLEQIGKTNADDSEQS